MGCMEPHGLHAFPPTTLGICNALECIRATHTSSTEHVILAADIGAGCAQSLLTTARRSGQHIR
eukprot:5460066-Prorocentrum_lima.AAC.1